MGGAVGQWVALNAPERITHLVLANTSPRFGEAANWNERIASVRKGGMQAIVDAVMRRFFSEKTLASGRNPYVDSVRSVFLGTNPVGYIGCCAALREFDSRESLTKIHTPSLVIAGDVDPSTPWTANGEVLARQIPNAKALRLPAAHLSNLEQPRSFTARIMALLLPLEESGSLKMGFEARRKVLGDAHVDNAIANTTDFTRDFQDLITRYAWGEIWGRPLLDDRTRRLIVLALMAALGRWEEFRMHVAAGLDHETETPDIKEVLLLVALYAGLPAANTGFHIAQEEIARKQS
jgi:3-oxoadipate enol-lactonase / 4-carboxymuconolactone decarboxylase